MATVFNIDPSTECEFRCIQGRTLHLPGEMTFNDFDEQAQKFRREMPENSWVVMSAVYGDITLIETRFETVEEFNERIECAKEKAINYQTKKDKQWARQKAKFARARK